MQIRHHFGMMLGLCGYHWICSGIRQESLEGKHEFVAVWLVHASECLHQMALDQGSWATATLLFEDPLARGSEWTPPN